MLTWSTMNCLAKFTCLHSQSLHENGLHIVGIVIDDADCVSEVVDFAENW